jgi:ribosome biogenesis GTPase
MQLDQLGWADFFHTGLDGFSEPTWIPARVISSQREHLRVWTHDRIVAAALSGKLRHSAAEGELPIVGDWVAASLDPPGDLAVVQAVLPRRSTLARKRAGNSSEQQLIAANVDLVFAVSALNQDFSPRRLERALALIWEGGAEPVVLLTKLDTAEDSRRDLDAARAVALGVPVHALSVHSGEGLEALRGYLVPGRTVALIGSSGVGKSTLVNWCLGEERAATSATRAGDDKGRHTTTTRELFLMPEGSLLIDTPGMRELGLSEASVGLEATFEDVEALIANCRFADCQHQREPGCAVQPALKRGELDGSRYAGYQKLQRELAHEHRRRDERARIEHQRELRKVFRQRAKASRARSKR